jgi:predicted naringenin-chalcone synthase
MSSPAVLRSLQTVVPDTVLHQSEVRDVFAAQPDLSRLARRIVTASFDGSGIDTRRTVLDELTLTATDAEPVFFDHATGLLSPATGVRNDVYVREAGRLFVAAARAALDADPEVGPADITHVVTVSCTGFHAPGPEYGIVRALGLSDSVQRYHLGFMGCYASMPALRAASQFCAADPDAVVLVVSVELCTLHLRSSEDPDVIVASSLFADGAAAGIVTARPSAGPGCASTGSTRSPRRRGHGVDHRDHGFEMTLSTAVPQIIGETIVDALHPLYAGELEAPFEDGGSARRSGTGRSIPADAASWTASRAARPQRPAAAPAPGDAADARQHVQRDDPVRAAADPWRRRARDGDRVSAMAFGPGLTAESALMTVVGAEGDGR